MRGNTKPIAIKNSACTFGRSAANDIELTLRDLASCPDEGLREPRGDLNASQKSAEGRKLRNEGP